jgi:calcium binding protein 39
MAHNLVHNILHKAKSKSPNELVSRLAHVMDKMTDTSPDKLYEESSKLLASLKAILYAENQTDQTRESAVIAVYDAAKWDLPLLLANKIGLLEFEAKKDAAQVFGFIVRLDAGGDKPGVQYVLEHPDILTTLFSGYEIPEIALSCGSMLRDCVRDEALAQIVLTGPLFSKYFQKVEVINFEVASDAFSTLKDLLTRHRALVARHLLDHYDEFFQEYVRLLQSSNYVTRRQSLKLLGELLLDQANVKVMMRYVSDAGNLKLMMMLLRDSSRSIQFEAFHVFKIFVANPNKTMPVIDILVNNKEKLLKYLSDFHTDKEDEQFRDEKAVIIKEIAGLQPPAGVERTSSTNVW